jgi:hypothetical protein
MKKILTVISAIIVLLLIPYDDVFTRGSDNKRDANNYCKEQKKKNISCKVSKWVGCGSSWTKAKRFNRHRGKDWFACKKTKFAKKGDQNKAKCKAWSDNWTKKNAGGYSYCSDLCIPAPSSRILKRFRGKGKNWCAKISTTKLQNLNMSKCKEWLRGKQGIYCKKERCGNGYTKAKSWGKLTYKISACTKSRFGEKGEKNHAACLKYCSKKQCQCKSQLRCGAGWRSVRSFRGKGKNWWACYRR